MNYEPESEENRIDQTLRDKFAEFELKPAAPVWASIAGRIGHLSPPAGRPPRRWLPVPLLLFLTAVVSGVSGWLLPHSDVASHPVAKAAAPAALSAPRAALSAPRAALSATQVAQNTTQVGKSATRVASVATGAAFSAPPVAHFATRVAVSAAPVGAGTNSVTTSVTQGATLTIPAVAPTGPATVSVGINGSPTAGVVVLADSTPATLRPLVALEKQSLTQLPTVFAVAATADSRTNFIVTLRAERHEILRLQRRTDSLLLALGDVLPANPSLAARLDSAQHITPAKPQATKKWSLLLTAAPEQNYLGFDAPARDELTNLRRNQETGRAGINAAIQAEYQATKRVSVAAGVGYSSYGSVLRQAVQSTDYRVTGYDTTITENTRNFTSTYNTYSIRIVQIPQLNPVFNAGGQVISYDTVYIPRNDTLRSVITSNDVVHDTVRTLVPRLLPYTNTTYKTYRPDYRFLTLPFLVRYRLAIGSGNRLWTDVAAGAQLQFFLGGTQLVSNDGQSFHTETVSAGEGPFRALNVALTGSLNLNYALNSRFSVSVGPSLRWQAMSVFKPETGLRQQPTATGLQVGMRWKL